MPCSFRDALGQAGSRCEVSGTGLQKDADYESNSCDLPTIDLQQSCANKHYQILQLPQDTQKIFQRQSLKGRAYCHRWFWRPKACSNSNRQISNFQEGSSLMSAGSGAAFPMLCVITGGMQLLLQVGPQPPPAAEGHLGLAFSSGLSLVSSNDLDGSWGSPKATVMML